MPMRRSKDGGLIGVDEAKLEKLVAVAILQKPSSDPW